MKIIRKVFGSILIVFGLFTSILDAFYMVTVARGFPNIPDVKEFATSSVWVLIISILLTIAGALIFREQ